MEIPVMWRTYLEIKEALIKSSIINAFVIPVKYGNQ